MKARSYTFSSAVAAIALLIAPLFSHAAETKMTPPEADTFVKNSHYEANKAPAPEIKLDLSKGEKAVKDAFADLAKDAKKLCKKGRIVSRLNAEKSSLKVTAFKNYKIPVVGKFKHADGYLVWNSKDKEPKPEFHLVIDTGSYDSGVAERDSRVKHFLLHADSKKGAVAKLEGEYRGDLNPGRKDVQGKLKIDGHKYAISASSNVTKSESTWTIQSAAPTRLTVDILGKDFQELMALCNHEALTPVVDLEWDLTFDTSCEASCAN